MTWRLAFITTVLAIVALAVATLEPSGSAAQPAAGTVHADRILIEKSAHRLTLFAGDRVLKTYAVALGQGGLAAKTRKGDGRTPEGIYRIDSRNPHSAYHLALHISYPEARDIRAAAARGVAPGGQIMIHGLPNSFAGIGFLHRATDWTAGCIAVTNDEIEEIWAAVPDGTPVEIRP
jgi:murein L,D-transpeptidase YafK